MRAQDHFADALIRLNYAKSLDEPKRNKMIGESALKKGVSDGKL